MRHLWFSLLLVLIGAGCEAPPLDSQKIAATIRNELAKGIPESQVRERLSSWGAQMGPVQLSELGYNSSFSKLRPYPLETAKGLSGIIYDNPERAAGSKTFILFGILFNAAGQSIAADAQVLFNK